MTSTLTFKAIDKLLRGSIAWSVSKDGLEITPNNFDDFNGDSPVLLSVDDLNGVHPQIYPTLKALRVEMNRLTRRDCDGGLYRDYNDGRYPRACIRQLCAPFELQDVRGHKSQIAYIWDILWETTDKRVFFQTMSYDLPDVAESASPNGVVIPARVSSQQFRVSKEWMEDTYPGWENRVNTGRALGLNGEDLIDYVCREDAVALSATPPSDITPT